MRKIKFRGKNYYDKWIYGNLRIDIYHNNTPTIEAHDSFTIHRIKPQTVGQFTGLHDSNGKEIYEGDIIHIRLSTNTLVKVVWHNEDAAYYLKTITASIYDYFGASYLHTHISEVIGNVHDNSDLMKGGEK